MQLASQLLPLFPAVPLVSAALALLAPWRRVRDAIMLIIPGIGIFAGLGLLAFTSQNGVVAHTVGLYVGNAGIAFAADSFSALLIITTMIVSFGANWFAIVGGETKSRYYPALTLILITGVNGALITADLFNFFVFIEVMLLPSYGLYVLSANRREPLRRVDGARLYVTLNLLTSTILVVAVGFLYALTGTVNLAVMAGAAARDERVAIAGGLVLFALSIKASVVPLHGWLARAYPSTSPAVTAIFAALHTKVAVYALYRVFSVLFDNDARFLPLLLALAGLTLAVGALASVGVHGVRLVLSWQMVSGIGGILVGLGLSTQLGLSAGLFYLVHHMVAMGCLLAATAAVEVRYGTGRLADLRGLAKREPLIAVVFFVGLLSIVGIPPFSGFVGKLMLVTAGVEAGRLVTVAVVLVGSLVSLWALLRVWDAWFWGEPGTPHGLRERLATAALPVVGRGAERTGPSGRGSSTDHERTESWTSTQTIDPPTGVLPVTFAADEDVTRSRIPVRLAMPGVVLAAATLVLGLAGQALWTLTDVAAQGLLDPARYIEAVLAP